MEWKLKTQDLVKSSPGIKAKKIATALGMDRKSINSYLHTEADIFLKDDDFGWHLKNLDSLTISLQENCWITCHSFEGTLRSYGSPLDSTHSKIVFIFPKGCKILIEATARLLALCNQLVAVGKDVLLDFTNCKQTYHVWDRTGFFEHLNASVFIKPGRPTVSKADQYRGKSSALVEFGFVCPQENNKELINQLSDRFVEYSSQRYDSVASTVFGEFIGNVSEHSQTQVPGFAALQKYRGSRHHIQTVISDSGLGIANTLIPSLEAHHPLMHRWKDDNDFEMKIVEAVLTKGEISRFGSGRGLGFKSSVEQAAKFDARLSVRQKNFSIELIYKDGNLIEITKEDDLISLLGTHICLDFYVD